MKKLRYYENDYEKTMSKTPVNQDVFVVIDLNELDKETIDLILKGHPNARIAINSSSFRTTREDAQQLVEGKEYIKNEYGLDLYFDNFDEDAFWTVDRAVAATQKLEGWVEEVNNARVDGRELSPYEKYLYAYTIVTNFAYKESEENLLESRNIIGVLTSDKIVCVGYAELLAEFCRKLGIECEKQNIIAASEEMTRTSSNHANCKVKIVDPLYNLKIEGYADPCWDSRREASEGEVEGRSGEAEESNFFHSLMSFSDVSKIFNNNVFVEPADLASLAYNKIGVEMTTQLFTSAIGSDGPAWLERKNVVCQRIFDQMKKWRQELGVEYNPDPIPEDDVWGLTQRSIEWGAEKILGVTINRFILGYEAEHSGNPDAYELVNVIKLNKFKIKDILRNKTDEMIESMIREKYDRYCTLPLNVEFSDEAIEWAKMRNHPTPITKLTFGQALRNVYIAQGMSKEEAEKLVREKYELSVNMATQGRRVVDPTADSIFVQEAARRNGIAIGE